MNDPSWKSQKICLTCFQIYLPDFSITIPRKLLLAQDKFNKSRGSSCRKISWSVSIGISVICFKCPRRPLTYLSRLSDPEAWRTISVSSTTLRPSLVVLSTFWRFWGELQGVPGPISRYLQISFCYEYFYVEIPCLDLDHQIDWISLDDEALYP